MSYGRTHVSALFRFRRVVIGPKMKITQNPLRKIRNIEKKSVFLRGEMKMNDEKSICYIGLRRP